MPTILRDLPFFDRPTSVHVQGREVTIRHDQIVVWVSLAPQDIERPDRNTPRFPAVLDTGFNHSFILHNDHLVRWAGFQSRQLRRLASVKVYGSLVPQFAINVWLHRNLAGLRDELMDQSPVLIETSQGVAVVPDGANHANPRLPLLGLSALRWNRLHLTIDGHRHTVNLRTQRRFWFFG